MKKLKLKTLEKKELNKINGGRQMPRQGPRCSCGCNYEGTEGGSSSEDNSAANNAEGLHSGL